MAWKQLNQMTFADVLTHEHEAIKELDEIHELIDWKQIENRLININNKETGERAWPPLMMFKILLLQSFYNLSDPTCEKQFVWDLKNIKNRGVSNIDLPVLILGIAP